MSELFSTWEANQRLIGNSKVSKPDWSTQLLSRRFFGCAKQASPSQHWSPTVNSILLKFISFTWQLAIDELTRTKIPEYQFSHIFGSLPRISISIGRESLENTYWFLRHIVTSILQILGASLSPLLQSVVQFWGLTGLVLSIFSVI